MIRIATGMQNLQRDFCAFAMHGRGDFTVMPQLPRPDEITSGWGEASRPIGSDATGDDQANAAFGARGIERCQFSA